MILTKFWKLISLSIFISSFYKRKCGTVFSSLKILNMHKMYLNHIYSQPRIPFVFLHYIFSKILSCFIHKVGFPQKALQELKFMSVKDKVISGEIKYSWNSLDRQRKWEVCEVKNIPGYSINFNLNLTYI